MENRESRIENGESRIEKREASRENRESKLRPVPALTVKSHLFGSDLLQEHTEQTFREHFEHSEQ